jgi:hypothetical protein
MTMGPRLRKFGLTTHVTCSVGLLGAIAGFLALAVAGLTSQHAQMVRAAYLAMELTAWFVIVPLALASLLTGLVQSLGTTWGLFRHYWVLVKLSLTVFATVVLLLKMKLITYVAGVAAETTLSSTDLRAARTELVIHAAAGLLVLLLPAALSVYKPRGMTRYVARKLHEQHLDVTTPYRAVSRYEWCKQHEQHLDSDGDTDDVAGVGPDYGSLRITPGLAKVFGMATAIFVVLLFVVRHLTGRGFGSHAPW